MSTIRWVDPRDGVEVELVKRAGGALIAYPTAIEIHDADGDAVARIEVQDSTCAQVTIPLSVNATAWIELSEQIRLALVSMRLDGDEAPR